MRKSSFAAEFSRSEQLCCHVFLFQMVVMWNTAQVTRGGEVAVLAKAHRDVDIQALKIAFFDDTR